MANFDVTGSLNGTVEQVMQVLTSKELADALSAKANAELTSFTLDGDTEGAFTLTAVRQASTAAVPDMAKKFVGDTVTVTQTENWEAPDANGNRKATVNLDVAGAPAKVSGIETLTNNGEQTEYSVNGELDVTVPFIGGTIASKAAPYAGKVFNIQTDLINSQL